MEKFVLEGKVISRSNFREKIFIPRLSLIPSDLYAAISRVTSKEGLQILINDENGEDTNVTSNVVYKDPNA
ncbi:hypothetical protein MTR_2g073620 [Medicago truncatula]|uniref:Uncharacterized protein n=1 Tax=Medicago truncatula TaxID=3880 RepID=A0A072V943_MEDTR|nr:hypothetical protein MTR_2g073620 [Medicago truncatula]